MKKSVMVFGTFDGIHPGHVAMMKEALSYGDSLIVVVARDETVLSVKGKKPKYSESERLEEVKSLDMVSDAVLGNVGDKLKVVVDFKPDVICLGYDQDSFTAGLKERLLKFGLRPKIRRLSAYRPEKFKSSIINKSS